MSDQLPSSPMPLRRTSPPTSCSASSSPTEQEYTKAKLVELVLESVARLVATFRELVLDKSQHPVHDAVWTTALLCTTWGNHILGQPTLNATRTNTVISARAHVKWQSWSRHAQYDVATCFPQSIALQHRRIAFHATGRVGALHSVSTEVL